MVLATLCACLHQQAVALDIRVPSQARHARLLEFPGPPVFTWIPEFNPNFMLTATSFSGIGWPLVQNDWVRQVALVSPRHFVCAVHYAPEIHWRIGFLGNDGNQHDFGILSREPVLNPQGDPTDLMLCTLDSEVPAALGIAPFPVLNLTTEADYIGMDAVIFGTVAQAGIMPVDGFTFLVNDPGLETTRFAYFDYDANGGGADDCRFAGGDSGSPSFIMVNGQPAIIDTAAGVDTSAYLPSLPPNISRSYVSFVPAYLDELDALMAAQGYHMTRSHPPLTLVSPQISAADPLSRMKAGGVTLDLRNLGFATAHNITLRLTFSAAPDSVTGSGWICEAASPLVWNCRRGGLDSAASTTLTAAWSMLPDARALQISALHAHNGSVPALLDVSLPIAETFSSWIDGSSDPAKNADPDQDGISNLLEFAFGGDPSQVSPMATGGHPQLPQIERDGSWLRVRFPRRNDAGAWGIEDEVEITSDPASTVWETELPAGSTIQSAAYDPDSFGFKEVTVSLPLDAARRFVRVRVSLAE